MAHFIIYWGIKIEMISFQLFGNTVIKSISETVQGAITNPATFFTGQNLEEKSLKTMKLYYYFGKSLRLCNVYILGKYFIFPASNKKCGRYPRTSTVTKEIARQRCTGTSDRNIVEFIVMSGKCMKQHDDISQIGQ